MQRKISSTQSPNHNMLENSNVLREINGNKPSRYVQNKMDHTKKRVITFVRDNPFEIQKHMRMFSQKRARRKNKVEPSIMTSPKTVCDIDSSFYKIIEGRPLRQSTDVKVYMSNIRDITLFKADAAYLKDQIIQIDTSFADELRIYDKVNQLYAETKSNFIKFIKKDYNIAKTVQEQADIVSRKLNEKVEELNSLSFNYVKLRNEVDSLVAVFENLIIYYNFIITMSPNSWRELYAKNFDENNFFFSKMFATLDTPSSVVLDLYKSSTCFQKSSPAIYFKRPKQLIQIFDATSEQCLNYMSIKDSTGSILKAVLKSRDYFKKLILNEADEIKDIISLFEAETKLMEQKEQDYKTKFNRILFADFKNLYASYESTYLFTCVQYAHTQIFGGPEDPKDAISALAFNIENLYLQLSSKLDAFNPSLVHKVERELFTEDIKVMKRAHLAQRILREFKILKKALITSFEPPRQRNAFKKN